MRALLDTHTFLWFVTLDPKLPASIRTLIESDGDYFVSIASCWEIAIKYSKGKLDLGIAPNRLFSEEIEGNGLFTLAITRTHVLELINLPQAHGDPFDRLIVCQAKAENLVLLSADQALDAYGIRRLWS